MSIPDHASESLRNALDAMENGHWDRRNQEGARLNALDSIAWSLIGILSHLERKPEAVAMRDAKPQSRRPHRDEVDASPLKPIL